MPLTYAICEHIIFWPGRENIIEFCHLTFIKLIMVMYAKFLFGARFLAISGFCLLAVLLSGCQKQDTPIENDPIETDGDVQIDDYFAPHANDGTYGRCTYFGEQFNESSKGCCGSQPYLAPHVSEWLKIQKQAALQLRLGNSVPNAIVYRCSNYRVDGVSIDQCGGLGDRWSGITATFILAVALKKPFFMDNYFPDALHNYLLPRRQCDGSVFVDWIWPRSSRLKHNRTVYYLRDQTVDKYYLRNLTGNPHYNPDHAFWRQKSNGKATLFKNLPSFVEAIKKENETVYLTANWWYAGSPATGYERQLGYLFSQNMSAIFFHASIFRSMFELLFEPSRFVQTAIQVIAKKTGLSDNGSCKLGFDGTRSQYSFSDSAFVSTFSSAFVFGPSIYPFCKPWVSLHVRVGDQIFSDPSKSLASSVAVDEFFSCAESFQSKFGSDMLVLLVGEKQH